MFLTATEPDWDGPRRMLAALRAERERKRKHRFIRERCFNRFRVLELDQLRGLPRAHAGTNDSGVYFLWCGPRLTYIGKGNCIHDRLASHRRNGVRYTHATFEALHSTCALWCEAQYIKSYKPPLNYQWARA